MEMSGGRGRGRALGAAVGGLALAVALAGMPAGADVGPYQGGPTHYYTASDGTEIALSVMLPHDYDPARTYPTIFEIAGYENASASPDGRTIPGQTRDTVCDAVSDPDCAPDPPLAGDSHSLTSAIHYRDDYVVVHANLPGTGCSSGTFDLYDFDQAGIGFEVIEEWIVEQEWSNGEVGILGHSFGGITGFLIAAHAGLAAREGRTHHVVAATLSGLIDDVYRGITFPGGVLNTLFPPLWYLGIRPAFDIAGGTVQGVVRNAGNEQGQRCAVNLTTHRRTLEGDTIYQGVLSGGFDNDYWQRISLISYVDLIDVPMHITGTFQDEQTGARGFTHLWEEIPQGVPKRLLISNGDHDTNTLVEELWADRKAWMDYWMRDIDPDPAWGWRDPGGTVEETSVRTLFELHRTAAGAVISNGHLDTAGYPVEGTAWTDHYLCAGGSLTADRGDCAAGSASYVSGSRRQSWIFQTGYDVGPPVTTADGPDQLTFRGPVVGEGETWAIAGPILATLNLALVGQDTDLFVQIADEDTATGTRTYLQRGWLKASHRAIDTARSSHSNVDPARPNFLYRPWRPHTSAQNVASGQPVEYLVEIWPVAHVFRPGHRLVVIVTAPPAADSNYSFAAPSGQPVSQNTLFLNDPDVPSRITLPVIPAGSITDLGGSGPACPDYWHVRCTRG